MAVAKKVKLGKNASSFFDAITRLKVLPGQIASVSKVQAKSEKFRNALQNGWLVETNEEPKKEDAPVDSSEDEDETDFNKMKVAELVQYIEETYDLDEEELTKVRKMKKDDLISYIEEQEEEE